MYHIHRLATFITYQIWLFVHTYNLKQSLIYLISIDNAIKEVINEVLLNSLSSHFHN